jgi:hypothetical protein
VPADVAGARRAKQRIGDGVAHGVGVGVAVQPPIERHVDAAQHQRAALDEPVQIVPVPDAQASHAAARSRQQPLGHREVLRGGDLQVADLALHQVHGMAGQLGEHRLVRGLGLRRERQRLAQHADTERLGRLCEEDVAPREGADHTPLHAALDRIEGGQRRDGRAVSRCGRHRALDQPGAHERPRRVVDDHDVDGIPDLGEACRHRVAPPGAAGDRHDRRRAA